MAQTLQPGTPLQGGKYVIKQVLGQGGFGITYLARQVSLGRDVAIKEFFMQDNCLRDKDSATVSVPSTGSATQVEKYRKKFDKEARTLALLDHPHIVRVIEIFEENGTVYYVMQHLSGGSLKDLVKKRGPLPEDEALHWVGQIAEALKYMHQEHKICHYDVKPGNILLDRKGNAVLIDFGISKNYDKDGNETSTTPIGLSTGYAPIEQYQGISVFSPASDVYALGATLYCLVMGHPPVSSLTLAQGVPLEFDHPVSASTRNLISRAMKVKTNERPQSVDLFLDKPKKTAKKSHVPQKLLDDETTRLPGDDTPPEALEPSTKKKGKSLAMILGALAALCIVGGAIWAFNRSSQPSTEAPIETPADSLVATQVQRDRVLRGLEAYMVWVEGGTFTMGATSEQGSDAFTDEKPAHQVTLSGFYMCKYEVTQELWHAVMGSNPSEFTSANGYTYDQYRPVESVSWEDCQEFISKLNQMTGKTFRLPTEAEWEYAARGGNKSKGYKYAGSNTLGNVAWYDGNSGSTTHPVGQKTPNELDLYDMSGNVLEWCQDWYGDYGSGSQTNPMGPSYGSDRVFRGGSWENSARNCGVSGRFLFSPNQHGTNLGLRLAANSL